MKKLEQILCELFGAILKGNLSYDLQKAVEKAKREIEALSGSDIKKEPVAKAATEHKNVVEILKNDDDFQKAVAKLTNGREITAAVIIAAATFPAEKFLTVRALKERIGELNLDAFADNRGHFNSSVLQITSHLKRKYSYGEKGEHISEQSLMDNLPIKRGSKEVSEIIDTKNVLPSRVNKIQNALRLNQAGRTKALEYLSTLQINNPIIKLIIGHGIMIQ